jgi:hypothetical protein
MLFKSLVSASSKNDNAVLFRQRLQKSLRRTLPLDRINIKKMVAVPIIRMGL